jgi:hypothetical protein
MRINSTDPIPPVPADSLASEPRIEPRLTKPVAQVAKHQDPGPSETTSVIVEIQKGNKVVYKFIDGSNGNLIEQIPSQAMVNFSDAIDTALPSLRKSESQK